MKFRPDPTPALGPRAFRIMGLTRVTDITSLDILGIPVVAAFRPGAQAAAGNISVYNGKGFTLKQARLGAIMEAVERHTAEKCHAGLATRAASTAMLRAKKVRHIAPAELDPPRGTRFGDEQLLEWVAARNLVDGKTLWIPANAVFCPYVPPAGSNLPCYWSSNGLAASASTTAATLTAILELVERDRTMLAPFTETATCLDPTRIASKPALRLCKKFRDAGVNLVVKDITGELGIPTFLASCDDPHTHDVNLLNSGMASHWDAETALCKAILEAAQSRLTAIQGAREDLSRHAGRYGKRNYFNVRDRLLSHHYSAPEPKSDLSRHAKNAFTSMERVLEYLLEKLSRAGFSRIIAVEMKADGLNLPVVRAVIPGLQGYNHERRSRRLKTAMRNWVRRGSRR